ncbi:hypothetical protein E2C01_086842 [Portunus trituberculatus]|uniref:Uncharacterized protein n=1 Tax=Portunus trituberculatus TaxID=210409 RepID=A0A5B7JHG3_PORTR|nr:hypothetical protein [Portunus trituberculatus]
MRPSTTPTPAVMEKLSAAHVRTKETKTALHSGWRGVGTPTCRVPRAAPITGTALRQINSISNDWCASTTRSKGVPPDQMLQSRHTSR